MKRGGKWEPDSEESEDEWKGSESEESEGEDVTLKCKVKEQKRGGGRGSRSSRGRRGRSSRKTTKHTYGPPPSANATADSTTADAGSSSNSTGNATAATASGDGTMTADASFIQIDRTLNRYQKNRIEKTVNAIVKVADVDGNGKINWEEALAIFKKGVYKSNPKIKDADFKKLQKMYRKVFEKFDGDNSGELDKKELKAVVK